MVWEPLPPSPPSSSHPPQPSQLPSSPASSSDPPPSGPSSPPLLYRRVSDLPVADSSLSKCVCRHAAYPATSPTPRLSIFHRSPQPESDGFGSSRRVFHRNEARCYRRGSTSPGQLLKRRTYFICRSTPGYCNRPCSSSSISLISSVSSSSPEEESSEHELPSSSPSSSV